jgi:hypothetical protein
MCSRTAHTLAALAATALLMAGCSSSPASSADWKAPQDVVDAIASSGLKCRASGEPTIDTSSESKGYVFVACDDYGVILITDKSKFDPTDKGNCTRLDDTFWSQIGKQPVVVGSTFRIASVAQSGQFPASPSAEELAKAFDGEATTLGDYYSKICGVAKPTASAKP